MEPLSGKILNRLGIPTISVRENQHQIEGKKISWAAQSIIIVENYVEAAGVITAMREGISLESLRRPLEPTRVEKGSE